MWISPAWITKVSHGTVPPQCQPVLKDGQVGRGIGSGHASQGKTEASGFLFDLLDQRHLLKG
jgi:hypothetical protein